MHDDARHLIAQHARTTRLLGVDFLPLGDASAVMGGREPGLGDERRRAVSTAMPERAPSAQVEAKPAGAPAGDDAPASAAEIRVACEGPEDPVARLEALRAKYESDAPHRHFNTSFTNIVFGEGSATAELMFIGEAPGEQEDLTGRPFVGRAGQLLEKMIGAMGYSRQSVYICNVLKTRPPNNATPTPRESELCAPYLIEQIRIVRPRVIVTLGLPATHVLLQTSSPMRSLRGRWHAFPPEGTGSGIFSDLAADDLPKIEVMPTYHPAYLLRSYTEENRRKVWSDLRQVMDKLA